MKKYTIMALTMVLMLSGVGAISTKAATKPLRETPIQRNLQERKRIQVPVQKPSNPRLIGIPKPIKPPVVSDSEKMLEKNIARVQLMEKQRLQTERVKAHLETRPRYGAIEKLPMPKKVNPRLIGVPRQPKANQ